MTREEAQNRKRDLEKRREALVDQISGIDAQSASISSDGGSRSYTNRSVADIRSKIAFLDKEIARLEYLLGQRANPSAIRRIDFTFNG